MLRLRQFLLDPQQLIADVVNTIDNGSDDDLALADAVVKVISQHLQLSAEELNVNREDDD